MAFKEDLEEGRRIERLFASQMMLRDTVVWVEIAPDKQFKDWDVKVKYSKNWVESYSTVEIKYDKKSEQTWNVWFEYECFWLPSGICTSKADYVVYFMDGRFYCQWRWNLLNKLFKIDKHPVSWWDFDWANLFLISKHHLNDLFYEIK